MRKGMIPGFRSALSIDNVLRGGKLVQEVEAFKAKDELALCEGLTEGGVEDEVVGVQRGATVAATTVHTTICRYGESPNFCSKKGGGCVAGFKSVAEVKGVQG